MSAPTERPNPCQCGSRELRSEATGSKAVKIVCAKCDRFYGYYHPPHEPKAKVSK